MSLVRVQTEDGRLVAEVEEAEIIANSGHYELVRNRRGYLKRAILRGRDLPLTSLERTGLAFQQQLAGGRVWALRGVLGSAGE